jgi:ABC-2 type transport system permease protein
VTSAFACLLRKEWLHIRRDRRTLLVVIFMPIIQVILFGYAIRTDISAIRLAVVDPSPDAATLELRNRFAGTDAFRVVRVLPNAGSLDRLFASGAIQEAVVFDPDFGNKLARGLPARVLVVVDASEPNSGSAMESYAIGVIQSYQRDIATRRGVVTIVPEARMRFNPTRASSNLFVPGLIAFVLTIISALMTAISLTREKETGTMEILLVSPLRPLQIIVGKVLAYLVIGFVSVLLVVAEARLVFAVPLRGSLILLLAEGLLFILTSLSLGILISSRTSSQRVAMIGALAGTMLPTILLSGFIFPISSMPHALQLVTTIVPARYFLVALRGIVLKGTPLVLLWPQMAALTVYALAMLTLASVRLARERH